VVWPTLGSRTAKEQNRTWARPARNVYEIKLHIGATWRIPLNDPRSTGGDAAVYKMFIHHVGRKIKKKTVNSIAQIDKLDIHKSKYIKKDSNAEHYYIITTSPVHTTTCQSKSRS